MNEIDFEFRELVHRCANQEIPLEKLIQFAREKKIPMGTKLDELKFKEILGGPASVIMIKLTLGVIKKIN